MLNMNKVEVALKRSALFQKEDPKVQKVIVNTVQAVPKVLGHLLNQPVTPETLLQAKVQWMEFLDKIGFGGKCILAAPERYPEGAELKEIVQKTNRALKVILKFLRQAEQILPNRLQTSDKIREWLTSKNGAKLNPEVMHLFDQGVLTIQNLLELQPDFILMYDPN